MATPTQIDALFTTVSLDATGFTAGIAQVNAVLDTLEQRFNALGQTVAAVAAGITTSVAPLASALSRVADFMYAASSADFQRIRGAADPVNEFARSFAAACQTIMSAELTGVSLALNRVGNFMEGARRFRFDSAGIDELVARLTQFAAGVVGINAAMPAFDGLTKGWQRVASFLNAMARLDTSLLAGAIKPITDFFTSLAGIDVNAAMAMGAAFNALTAGLNAVVRVNTNPLVRIATELNLFFNTITGSGSTASYAATLLTAIAAAVNAMGAANAAQMRTVTTAMVWSIRQLNSLRVGAGAQAAINALHAMAHAVNTAAGSASGGGGKGPFSGLLTALGAIPPGAGRVTVSMERAGEAKRRLADNANSLTTALGTLAAQYLTVTGAMRLFRAAGQVDDTLTRVMAKAGIAGRAEPGDRRAVENAVLTTSLRSPQSPKDIAEGMGVLTSAGMSAGMAIRGLAVAEEFATASGTKMADAAKKLTIIQSEFGLAVTDVTGHLELMKDISDVLVGTSAMVGQSETQLADAMTGKLAIAARDYNMTMNETLALLGTIGRLGENFQGKAGGNTAARMIEDIQRAAIKNRPQWRRLLGEDVIDDSGKKMKDFIGTVDLLSRKFETFSPAQTAELGLSGFEEKDLFRVKAILGQAGSMAALRDRISETGGSTKTVSDQMKMSLGKQLEMLQNSGLAAASVLGQRLAPAFYLVTEGVRQATEWFINLNPALQNLIVMGLSVAAAWLPVTWTLGAVAGFVSGLLSPIRVVIGVLWQLTTAAVSVAAGFAWTALSYGISLVTGAVSLLWSGMMAAAGALYGVMSTAFSYFNGLALRVMGLGDTLGRSLRVVWFFSNSLAEAIWRTMTAVIGHVVAGVAGMAMSLLTGVVSLLATLAGAAALAFLVAPLVITVLSGVAALGITVASAIGAAFAAIPALIAAIWERLKAGARTASAAVLDWAGDAETGVVAIWGKAKKGAMDFFESIKGGLMTTAGFFWNFGQNARIIGRWLSFYWREALEDVGNLAVDLFERMAGNAYLTVWAIGASIVSVITAAFQTVMTYLGAAFSWIGSQWKNVLSDMGVLLGAFIDTFMKNWKALSELFHKVASIEADRATSRFLGIETEANSAARDVVISKAVAEAKSKLVLDVKFDPTSLKTDRIDLKKGDKHYTSEFAYLMDEAFGTSNKAWGKVGTEIAEAFGMALEEMKPLADAFDPILKSPIWHELFDSLNLAVPDDAIKRTLEWFDQTLKPFTGGGEGDRSGLGGPHGQGPGFGFKQISMERTMTGGPELMALDYEQLVVMKSMDRKLGEMLTAQGQPWYTPAPTLGGTSP